MDSSKGRSSPSCCNKIVYRPWEQKKSHGRFFILRRKHGSNKTNIITSE